MTEVSLSPTECTRPRTICLPAYARTVAFAACLFTLAGVLPSAAMAAGAPDVVVAGAWVRETAPGQPVGAAYMQITSTRGGVLQQVTSDAAGEVQVHSMHMDGAIMRMRQLEQPLPLPAGQTVRLSPSANHLMLLDLKRPLRSGAQVRFELTVRDQTGRVHVVHTLVPVRRAGDPGTQ